MASNAYEKKIGYLLGERYRLEVRWKNTIYEVEGECRLKDAYFAGPALQLAEKIEPNNSMLIDFYKQYFIFAEDVYIATLSWKDVIYNDNGTVSLTGATITHDTEINRVPKLAKDDYLVIDLKGHDVADHPFNPTYTTIVVNRDDEAYNFWNQHGSYRKVGSK